MNGWDQVCPLSVNFQWFLLFQGSLKEGEKWVLAKAVDKAWKDNWAFELLILMGKGKTKVFQCFGMVVEGISEIKFVFGELGRGVVRLFGPWEKWSDTDDFGLFWKGRIFEDWIKKGLHLRMY